MIFWILVVQVDKELVVGTWGKQETSQAIENFQVIEVDEKEYVRLFWNICENKIIKLKLIGKLKGIFKPSEWKH